MVLISNFDIRESHCFALTNTVRRWGMQASSLI